MDNKEMLKKSLLFKSKAVCFILWFIFGLFGGDRFYVGKKKEGVAMLILSALGFMLSSLGYPLILLLLTGIWTLLNLLKFWGEIDLYNQNILNK